MAKNKKDVNETSNFDVLNPFGQYDDLKIRMVVDSHQESYNSEITRTKKDSGLSVRVKSKRFNSTRNK